MRFSLGDDEEVALDLHPHWKTLILPALIFIVTSGAAAFLAAIVSGGKDEAPAQWIIAGLALFVVLTWSVRPLLRWRTTSFVLTNRRIITREGVLVRRGHDVPISRIHDVSFSRTLLERLLGCGTLVIESAGEYGQVILDDIPHVEVVQAELYRLVDEEAREDSFDGDGGETGEAGEAGETGRHGRDE